MTPTVAEVLAELEFSRGYFPREAVQAAVRLGSAIVEPLIASIAFATCEHADLPRDYVLHLSALHVLAELRERRAYPAIVALCRLTEPELDELIGFVLTESLPQILASVALDDDSLLRGLVEDASVSEWVRAGAIHAMACCAVEGTIAHDRFLAYFGELWRGGRLLRQANAVWDEMACVATDLGLSEFLADIERAFDEGFLDGMMIGREDAVEELSGSPDRFQPRSQKRYRFLPDAAAELGRWHGMWRVSGEECTQPVVQSARRQQKVGRNDRCPCGSGKKYKKCCLQLGGDAGATAGM